MGYIRFLHSSLELNVFNRIDYVIVVNIIIEWNVFCTEWCELYNDGTPAILLILFFIFVHYVVQYF